MVRERLIWCFVTAAIGILVFGSLKPASLDPLDNAKTDETWFFIHKTHEVRAVPGIILGDSRALRGLAPDEIARTAGGKPPFNFSYESGGMNDEMYDAVDSRLAPEGRRNVILAITPLAFMPWKTGNAQYREYLHKPRDVVALYRYAPSVAEYFSPASPAVLIRLLLRVAPKIIVTQAFHDNGWIETDQTPITVESETENAVVRLAGNRVSPELIESFMDRTRNWTDAGIRVFALRPPSTPTMHVIEDTTLGFDQELFIRDFTAAGGFWIDSNEGEYESYDGSHLRAEEARRYSRAVGAALQRYQAGD